MNLVLCTGWGYETNLIQVFVESWKKYLSHNSKLIMVVEPYINKDKIDYLIQSGVDARFYTAAYFLPSAIHNTRYFKYLDILLEEPDKYERVFLCDVRDLAFQGDIFKEIPAGNVDLFVNEEDPRFNLGERFNKHILTMNYGEDIAKELEPNRILCSGTTLGSKEAIVTYIVTLMNKINMRNDGSDIGYDQAHHNYIFYNNLIPHKKLENGIGVGTLCLVPSEDVKILKDGRVQVYDKIPSVIHQWDRHHVNEPHLFKHYAALYNVIGL